MKRGPHTCQHHLKNFLKLKKKSHHFKRVDPSAEVRVTVAEQKRGKDLDILVHDNDHRVRMTVVEQNRPQDLDILVNDSSHYVRMAVAEQGRQQDLDILIHDKDTYVRRVAIAMFEKLKTERNP